MCVSLLQRAGKALSKAPLIQSYTNNGNELVLKSRKTIKTYRQNDFQKPIRIFKNTKICRSLHSVCRGIKKEWQQNRKIKCASNIIHTDHKQM